MRLGKHEPSWRAPRAGVALLEVIVAVAVLTLAGVSAAMLASESAEAARRAHEADEEVRQASAFLDIVSLWPREDLDRRLGERPQGPWRLRVDRPEPALYMLSLRDSTSGAELLYTAVYRPDSNHVFSPPDAVR